MDVSASPGMLFKFKEWIEKKLFKRHYERSHSLYLEDHSLGNYWEDIAPGVQVSLKTESVYSNLEPPLSTIAIRCKPDTKIDYLKIRVTTRSYCKETHDVIEAWDVGELPQVHKLLNFPVSDVWFDERADGFLTSYSEIQYTIVELVSNGEKVKSNFKLLQSTPTHYEVLNPEFVYKWGNYYSVELYKEAKIQLSYYIQIKMFGSVSNAYFLSLENRRNWNLVRSIRLAILNVILKEKVLNALFWSLYLAKLVRVDDRGRINLLDNFVRKSEATS